MACRHSAVGVVQKATVTLDAAPGDDRGVLRRGGERSCERGQDYRRADATEDGGPVLGDGGTARTSTGYLRAGDHAGRTRRRAILGAGRSSVRVLFVYPNLYTQMGFNHGLASLSACLKAAGHETRLVNLNENLPPVPTREDVLEQALSWEA